MDWRATTRLPAPKTTMNSMGVAVTTFSTAGPAMIDFSAVTAGDIQLGDLGDDLLDGGVDNDVVSGEWG